MNKTFQKLEKKIKKIESEYGNLDNFVEKTTNFTQKHTMKIDEKSFDALEYVYEELQDLEIADLIDFQKHEDYGKFD